MTIAKKTTNAAKTTKREPRAIGGWLLPALLCLAAWVLSTAIALRDPLKLMLEWELLAVFVRPGTHGWYRTVIVAVGCDVIIGAFIVAGAGWLSLLAWRKSARFPVQVQAWLVAIVVMRTGAYLLGDYMCQAIAIDIAMPFGGFIQALVAATLGIPYFRLSRRVQETFVAH
ncbi:DUF2569 domain-containing protein [Paraburkholderia lacunae]|uniref:DUF2569 domain-containing protein n=1 Tax=Paraburkholderia lacunae TaxID=2211104 RepID=A0A370N393_9BURK|nr:DUF2569 domain-containing protein [Paraburkholderia lacunae]RDK00067.1 DUF2569 domain-containing protein [Paraburkholderia lacunae]